MNEKEVLKEKIIKKLEKVDILWFIKNEVYDSLDYLNKYKLKNLYLNMDKFIEDLKRINTYYIKSL